MNEQHINSSTPRSRDRFKAHKQDPVESLATILSMLTCESQNPSTLSQKGHHIVEDLHRLTRKFDCHMTLSSPRNTQQDEPSESNSDWPSVDDSNLGVTAMMTSFLESLKKRYDQDASSPRIVDFNDSDDDDDDDDDDDYDDNDDDDNDSLDSMSYYRRNGLLLKENSRVKCFESLLITLPPMVSISGDADNLSMLPNPMNE